MTRLMMTAAVAATTLIAGTTAGLASGYSTSESACAGRLGGAQTHTIVASGAGFFPDITYACPGDTVNFVADNSHWVQMKVQDYYEDGSSKQTGWQQNGQPIGSMSFTVRSGVENEMNILTSHPKYPDSWKMDAGSIVLGLAPTQYMEGERYSDPEE